ncbi:MAG TPA: SMP-30/gluconolactonase/LRE family protein [Chitinophagaceae bacterium]|nr:SMP-30/gluconolactonase/LRE family protein [Chitinophagaceae bacterium]
MNKLYLLLLLTLLINTNNYCQVKTGHIEKNDPALDAIIDSHAKVEIIAEGFDWCEGPLWIEQQKMLLFSDVPKNIIYKWTEKKGKEVYLTPSGYTGTIARGGEIGSNGLVLNKTGQLVICQDGDRQMAFMNAGLQNPKPVFTTLTNNYQGKKFNSPNDAVYNNNGDLFFTDPPYGLEKNMDDPLKEIPFQGVYKIRKTGALVLLTDSITRPNGIAIMPDQKTLIIANSDPLKPYWYAYDFGAGDQLINPRIFYDASEAAKSEAGMPDGLKIDKKGNVFATGPGGVWIFNKKGNLLGKIKFDGLTSNCSLSADEKTIYITADMYVLRVKMRK